MLCVRDLTDAADMVAVKMGQNHVVQIPWAHSETFQLLVHGRSRRKIALVHGIQTHSRRGTPMPATFSIPPPVSNGK